MALTAVDKALLILAPFNVRQRRGPFTILRHKLARRRQARRLPPVIVPPEANGPTQSEGPPDRQT
jgi:hypothetical protein